MEYSAQDEMDDDWSVTHAKGEKMGKNSCIGRDFRHLVTSEEGNQRHAESLMTGILFSINATVL
jgi:hypothetical protein